MGSVQQWFDEASVELLVLALPAYNYMIRRYQDEVTQKSLKNYHTMPFSSLVHMHTNHYLLKITELEYSQCACMEAKRGELWLCDLSTTDSVFEQRCLGQ